MIGRNPNIMGGTACIRGTRITVYALEARINGGETPEAVSADYEGYITPEQIRALNALTSDKIRVGQRLLVKPQT